jgi:hypothetical protein
VRGAAAVAAFMLSTPMPHIIVADPIHPDGLARRAEAPGVPHVNEAELRSAS